jgi:hypothetical protein
MINKYKIITNILNFSILFSFIAYTILFYFQIKIQNIENFIIINSIIAILFKSFCWYTIKILPNEEKFIKKSNLFFLRLIFFIFSYILPPYYLIQKNNLVVSDYVILITLIIISIFILAGIIVERYLIYFELTVAANS